MEILSKTREEIKETKTQFFEQTLTLLNGAFALIAALAWNEAIKALLERYFKADAGLFSLFIYAIFITLVVVIVTMRLSKISKKYIKEEEKQDG